jgi:hypothetical protein
MATLGQLEEGLKKAYSMGNMEYARLLAAEIIKARQRIDKPGQIPTGATKADEYVDTRKPTTPEPGLLDTAIGAGETGLALVTGATTGAVGMVGGTVKGIGQALLDGSFGTREAADAVEKSAVSGMEALTRAPRTAEGQRLTQGAGEVLQNLIPLAGLPGEVGVAMGAAGVARPLVGATLDRARGAVAPGLEVVRDTLGRAAGSIGDATKRAFGREIETPAPQGSVGAMSTEEATMRQARADELPVPIQLTLGQRAKGFSQQQFEREAAKNPEIGEPLRQRFAEQHAEVNHNFDAMLSDTGARADSLRGIGEITDKAVRNRLARDTGRMRQAYQEADAAGEMKQGVDLQPLIDHLNNNRAGILSAPIMGVVERQLKIQGLATGSLENGTLRLKGLVDEPPPPLEFPTLETDHAGLLAKARPGLDEWIESGGIGTPEDTAAALAYLRAAPPLTENKIVYRLHQDPLPKEAAEGKPFKLRKEFTSTSDDLNSFKEGVLGEAYAEGEWPGQNILEIRLPAGKSYGRKINHSDPDHPENLQSEFLIGPETKFKLVGKKPDGTTILEAVEGVEPPKAAISVPPAPKDYTPTLKEAELLRRTINRFTKAADKPDLKASAEMKAILDAQTEGLGGEKYKRARGMYRDIKADYEDNYLVSQLLGTKRGYADRAVAFENVLDHVALSPNSTVDALNHVKRLLHDSGPEGRQAWSEIRGGVIQHIQEQTFKNVDRNSQGQKIPSAVQLERIMKNLDRDGKLEVLYGKRGAEQLRTLNEVVKDVMVSDRTAVNHSNTASIVLASMDMAISGMAHMPAPILSALRATIKGIKNKKLRARVNAAINVPKAE